MGRLCIVTGANGALGRAYLEGLRESGEECIGVSRSTVVQPVSGVRYIEGVDLLSPLDTECMVQTIGSLERDIALVHPVGKFTFEWGDSLAGASGEKIDPEVYRSNVETFQNIAEPLLRLTAALRTEMQITLCGFGSVSDTHDVPYWYSYSAAKNALRTYIRGKIAEHGGAVRGLFVNVSTVDTGNENLLRPYADKRYWLKPLEVVRASLSALLGKEEGWREISVICRKSDVDPHTHYNPDVVLERWKREMGANPHQTPVPSDLS